MDGHPALGAARTHKARCEQWLLEMVHEEGHSDAKTIARALMILIDGAVCQILIHRDADYATSAGFAAQSLLSKVAFNPRSPARAGTAPRDKRPESAPPAKRKKAPPARAAAPGAP